MKKPLKELETRVNRTYHGGKLIDEFLGKKESKDSVMPEDWISSFVEAKNKDYIPNEGITRVEYEGEQQLITDVINQEDFGVNRTEPGVLIKYLDASERLGIQVHPTKEFAKKYFNSSFGKTECWYVLGTRSINGVSPVVYLGFKEHVTEELYREMFEKQDVEAMLDAMHKFEVKPGDTILIRGGMPHAIGSGCFILEIQEPSDYTMRSETTTVAGEKLTPQQIHYGIGVEAMLKCFDYTPRTREEIEKYCFIKPRLHDGIKKLVDYEDTPCFKLEEIEAKEYKFKRSMFTTLIIMESGTMVVENKEYKLLKGEKYFISALCDEIILKNCKVVVCYPPQISQ